MSNNEDDFKKLLSGALKVKNKKIDESGLVEISNSTASRSNIPVKRTCENCICDKSKNLAKPKYTYEELKEMPKDEFHRLANSGCQGCKLGDAFRCSDCPFKGLPSFQEGDDVFFD